MSKTSSHKKLFTILIILNTIPIGISYYALIKDWSYIYIPLVSGVIVGGFNTWVLGLLMLEREGAIIRIKLILQLFGYTISCLIVWCIFIYCLALVFRVLQYESNLSPNFFGILVSFQFVFFPIYLGEIALIPFFRIADSSS